MKEPINIINCFEDNSTINITAANGELVEGKSYVAALEPNTENLECYELIEDADLKPIKGNNMIIFTTSHEIVCKSFKECEE